MLALATPMSVDPPALGSHGLDLALAQAVARGDRSSNGRRQLDRAEQMHPAGVG